MIGKIDGFCGEAASPVGLSDRKAKVVLAAALPPTPRPPGQLARRCAHGPEWLPFYSNHLLALFATERPGADASRGWGVVLRALRGGVSEKSRLKRNKETMRKRTNHPESAKKPQFLHFILATVP
jgi:hypothetical protein